MSPDPELSSRCTIGLVELTTMTTTSTDLFSIGCITTPKDFVVAGTATDKLYGVAEGLWEPDLVSIRSSSLSCLLNLC